MSASAAASSVLSASLNGPGALSEADRAMLAAADAMLGKARDAMKTQALHHVLNAVWTVVAEANRYFAGEAPWALAKTDPARQKTVLYVTAEVVRQVAILAAADAMVGKAREAMKTQALHQVLNAVWAVVADANRYFAGEAPWALAKTDPARQRTVLYVTAEVIRQVAVLAQPFMPAAAAKLLDLLAVPAEERAFHALGGGQRIAAGAKLPPPVAVFPRYVESDPSAQA